MELVIICVISTIAGFIIGNVVNRCFIMKKIGIIHVIEDGDGTSFWLEIASKEDVITHNSIILEVRKDKHSHK